MSLFNRLRQAVVLELLLLLAGCVPSLNPLYERGDTSFRSELVGEWRDPDPNATGVLKFQSIDDEAYLMEIPNNDADGRPTVIECVAHLVELDGRLYLDVHSFSVSCSVC